MFWIELQRGSGLTLKRQIYDQIATKILTGDLAAGTRLPSSRELAAQHRVARNIAIAVYEQLLAEGFVETREGSGTFVSEMGRLRTPAAHLPSRARRNPAAPPHPDVISFICGTPDLARFPRESWAKCLRQEMYFGKADDWGYAPAAGMDTLREEIARHLLRVKGIVCDPGQILVTTGAAQGVQLSAMLLHERRQGALVEDPVVSFVPAILKKCGHRILPVRADDAGIDIDDLPARPAASLLFVSPSHQCPLGSTLPIQRRLALLEYARRWKLFVLEDDYDSEFRYSGAPVSSLFRLCPDRVIHIGTFAKSLAPSLRLGYVVVPAVLAAGMEKLIASTHGNGSRLTQNALARFIREGNLERHIVRMQRVYQRKMRCLESALARAFGKRVVVSGNTTGLHLMATFEGVKFDAAKIAQLERAGIEVDPVDEFSLGKSRHPSALAIAFGHLSFERIEEGVTRLAAVLPE